MWLMACTSDPHDAMRPDVYALHYWNTSWDSTIMSDTLLEDFSRVYIHVFDVDALREDAEPMPSFVIDTLMPIQSYEYVPIAYITARALDYYIEKEEIPKLAKRIDLLVDYLSEQNKVKFQRFVLDFDWSLSNQDSYFALLRKLKTNLQKRNIKLGATLRLHQLRLIQGMQAPDLDTLLLMCYNMQMPILNPHQNSIYSADDFETYARNIPSYPRPLELIIPVYEHFALFRQGDFAGFLRDIRPSVLENDQYFDKKNKQVIEVLEDYKLGRFQLYKGDQIKHESISPKELRSILHVLHRVGVDSPKVSIFDAKNYVQKPEMQAALRDLFF